MVAKIFKSARNLRLLIQLNKRHFIKAFPNRMDVCHTISLRTTDILNINFVSFYETLENLSSLLLFLSSHATLALHFEHEDVKKTPLFLDKTSIRFRRLGDLQHWYDALHFLCNLPDVRSRAGAAPRFVWRPGRHCLGWHQRSDHWHPQ